MDKDKVKDYRWLGESDQPTSSWINWVISLIKGEKKQLKDIIEFDYATKCPGTVELNWTAGIMSNMALQLHDKHVQQ